MRDEESRSWVQMVFVRREIPRACGARNDTSECDDIEEK
jgi:hypothetical protein